MSVLIYFVNIKCVKFIVLFSFFFLFSSVPSPTNSFHISPFSCSFSSSSHNVCPSFLKKIQKIQPLDQLLDEGGEAKS